MAREPLYVCYDLVFRLRVVVRCQGLLDLSAAFAMPSFMSLREVESQTKVRASFL